MQNVKLYWQIHVDKYLSTSIFNQFISIYLTILMRVSRHYIMKMVRFNCFH